MQRLPVAVIVLGGIISGAQAAAPGPLDGQDIPTDFAESKLVGLQTNRTGAGDVTSLQSVVTFSEGSELDALYLAQDSAFLYVGLAGNLETNGNAIILFIGEVGLEFLGQDELRAECTGGPPFNLQNLSALRTINTNGPGDTSDDVVVGLNDLDVNGTLLPCAANFALVINTSGGTMSINNYALTNPLFGAVSAGSCTPDNPDDDATTDLAFAARTFIGESPVSEDPPNDLLENIGGDAGAFATGGFGFQNINTAGVTDTDGSTASTATTGLEVAFPRSLLQDPNAALTIYTVIADGNSVVSNQGLPTFAGDAALCPAGTNGVNAGSRPDLSAIGCVTVDLATLPAFTGTAEGIIDASEYGGVVTDTQTCPTSFGDQDRQSEILRPGQDGSELDAMYVDNDDTFLYLGLTGNLQDGGTSINVFVDADPQASNGDQLLSDFSDFALSGTYEQWNSNGVFTSGADDFRVESTDWGGGFFDISPNINAAGATTLTLDFTANAANLADTVRVVLADGDGTGRFYDFAIPGLGTHSLSMPLSSFSFENNPGTVPGLDLANVSFFHIAGGFNNGEPGLALDLTFDNLALSDDDDGQHVLDFSSPAIFETIQIESFNGFSLLGTYVAWSTATFTTGTDFRVEESVTGGFGGGYGDIDNVNLSRAESIQLDLTINPASSSGGTVLLVLADTDDTQLQWSWTGLSPGSYALTASFDSGGEVFAGGIPGFDAANVSFIHLQANFTMTDITFENLSAQSVLPGAAAIVGMSGNELPNGPLDLLNNGQFIADAALQYDYVYGINVGYTPHFAYVDYFDLVNQSFTFRGAVEPESGNATLGDSPGDAADNPNGLMMAFDNTNTTGVIGCADQDPCFLEDIATVSGRAQQATTGLEMAIPLADLGLTAGDLPRVIRLWTTVGGSTGIATDQGLPPIRNGSGEGNQVQNPGDAPINFTDPAGGPNFAAVLSDFSNFALTGTYGTWGSAVFTSGATDFRVEGTDFGGGFFILPAILDASGATEMVVDITLNAANQTDILIVILFDGDGTVWVYRFAGLTNGTQTLTKDLRDFSAEDAPGSVPGLDLSTIGQFNIAGAFHNGNPGMVLDFTFDNIALVGEARNFEARAARICLGTVDGDADCDGDNDLADFALLQQCVGVVANPVLPMECEQLDFVKDRVINDLDIAEFVNVVDGP